MIIGRNIAVTNHAIERLEQRMGVKRENISRTVKRALVSDENVCEEFFKSKHNMRNLGFNTYFYRQYNDIVFVFQKKYIDVVLITVFRYDK